MEKLCTSDDKNEISLLNVIGTVFQIFMKKHAKPYTFTCDNLNNHDVIPSVSGFVKICTHSVSLQSVIVMSLEIGELCGPVDGQSFFPPC